MTTIYILPLRSKEMPLFEQIQTAGQVVQLPAARDMHLDDVVLLHLGNWHLNQESGVYAYGSVIYGPYILEGHPDHLCNNKNTVDVRIDRIERDRPIITHEQCKRFTGQYRSIHAICDSFNDSIKALLNIDYSSKPQKSKLGNKLNSYPKTIEKRTLFGDKFQEKRTKSRTHRWKRSCSRWALFGCGSVAKMSDFIFRTFVNFLHNKNMAMCATR